MLKLSYKVAIMYSTNIGTYFYVDIIKAQKSNSLSFIPEVSTGCMCFTEKLEGSFK